MVNSRLFCNPFFVWLCHNHRCPTTDWGRLIMTIEKLRELTTELEKTLEELKKQTDPKARIKILSHFKQVYFQIKSEIVEKSAS